MIFNIGISMFFIRKYVWFIGFSFAYAIYVGALIYFIVTRINAVIVIIFHRNADL